jgi:hypothetical protein
MLRRSGATVAGVVRIPKASRRSARMVTTPLDTSRAVTATSGIEQIGQAPGPSARTEVCIGQV